MPLIKTIQINPGTKVGIWRITEDETFFDPKSLGGNQISHPAKRLQHLAGRQLLKTLYPAVRLQDISVTSSGKPFLSDSSFWFSISHSKEYAAAIISETMKVGIDIERINEQVARVKNKCLDEKELRQARTDKDLTLYWSVKEAVYKWHGRKPTSLKGQIHIHRKKDREQDLIDVALEYDHTVKHLRPHYKIMDPFILVWVASE